MAGPNGDVPYALKHTGVQTLGTEKYKIFH